MNFKSLFLVLSLVILASCSKTIDQVEAKKNLKASCDKMQAAFAKKDFKTFVDFMHPSIHSKAGGKEEMVKGLETDIDKMIKDGYQLKELSNKDASQFLISEKNIQAIVEQNMVMELNNGSMIVKSNLLCISTDEGKTWQFIDIAQNTRDDIKQMVPDLNANFIWPAPIAPEFKAKPGTLAQ